MFSFADKIVFLNNSKGIRDMKAINDSHDIIIIIEKLICVAVSTSNLNSFMIKREKNVLNQIISL